MNQESITDGALDLEALEKMQTNDPIAVYVKTIVAKLGVTVLNPITRRPEGRILKGDPTDPSTDIDNITVKFWTNGALEYFKNVNKRLIEDGSIVPYTHSLTEVSSVNSLTDDEIDSILSEPFFTLKNKLMELTSSIPVERLLRKAIELNRPVGTINHIKDRLNQLQVEEGLDSQVNLEDYYKNISME